jgi:hypothetical protein
MGASRGGGVEVEGDGGDVVDFVQTADAEKSEIDTVGASLIGYHVINATSRGTSLLLTNHKAE